MTKNKKLKNRKRYLGNPFTIAFLPVLAATGLTLGATSLSMKSTGGNEDTKAHDIQIQPTPGSTWTLTSTSSRAKKGESVTFYANNQSKVNEDNEPVGVKINGSTYYFDDPINHKVTVKIDFVEKMIATLAFEDPQVYHIVTFNDMFQKTWDVTVKHNYFLDKPLTPVRPDYSFGGWYDIDPTGKEEWQLIGHKWDFENQKVQSDMTLYAKWSQDEEAKPHAINVPTGPVNGWQLSCSVAQATKGDNVTFTMERTKSSEQKPQSLIINGHIFDNLVWETENQKCSIAIQIIWGTVMNASMEFTDSPYTRHVVTFDSQGGSLVTTQKVIDGEKVLKPDDPTKTGYDFVDWFDSLESENPYDFNTSVEGPLTLYAKWTPKQNISVIFDPDNGEQSTVVPTTFGETPVAPANPTKTGAPEGYTYAFDYWKNTKTEAKGVQPVTSEDTEDNTYIAMYKLIPNQHTITFVVPNGPYITPIQVAYNDTIASAPEVEWPHHEITGWTYVNGEGQTVPWTFGESGTKVTGDTTITATYTTEQHKVTFKNPGDIGETLSGKVWQAEATDYGTTPAYKGPVPTIDVTGHNCIFTGWDKTIEPVGDADVVYTAQFDVIPEKYSLSFNTMGSPTTSEDYKARLVDYKTKLTAPQEPANPTGKTDYLFKGWCKDKSMGTHWDFDNDTIIRNTTLYADFIPPYAAATDFATESQDLYTINKYSGSLKQLSIPEKSSKDILWKVVGGGTFTNNTNVKEVHLPANIRAIAGGAFENATSLETINLGCIEEIGGSTSENAFKNSGLSTITIPTKLSYLGVGAFRECSKLTRVDIDSESTASYLYLNNLVFDGCTELSYVKLPKRTTQLNNAIFKNCAKLTQIYYDGTVEQWGKITKWSRWNSGASNLTKVICTDGEVEVTPITD